MIGGPDPGVFKPDDCAHGADHVLPVRSGPVRCPAAELGEGLFPHCTDVPADHRSQVGPLGEQEVAIEEGDEVGALPLGQNDAVETHPLPRPVEVVGAQTRPRDMQGQLDATVYGTGKFSERARQSPCVPGTQDIRCGW